MNQVIDWGIPIFTAHVSSDNFVSRPIPLYIAYCYIGYITVCDVFILQSLIS